MTPVLFLVDRMMRGWGVGVVVHNVALRLLAVGHRVTVGCLESDDTFVGLRIVNVPVDVEAVRRLATRERAVVVAHTSPFFELLPHLADTLRCYAWEHGDPTPAFFTEDAAERERSKLNKRLHCYPLIHGTIAISEFIRHDIGWPDSVVIHNGCDHAPDLGSKGRGDLPPGPDAPLTIGTLMRLGRGESRYKGNQLFVDLCERLRSAGVPLRARVMGRGTTEDAEPFRRRGIEVALSAPDEEKWTFLRGLDVFISCSLWEGFNLPVAEAQAVGTMSIAFDTGAHPEVTPFIVSDVDEAATLIAACHRDRTRLLELSRSSHQFVRSRFAWEHTAAQFSRLVETEPQSSARMYVGEGLARQLRRVRWIASDILASARARARARRNANR